MRFVFGAAALVSALCLGLVAYAGNVVGSPQKSGATMLPPISGERYAKVTQDNLATTVCESGFTSTIRPPVGYTSALKKWLLKDRQLPGTTADYQLDHLVSLELGGAPYSTDNLWMQPLAQAKRDDALENAWHEKLCAGTLTLKQARNAELVYKRVNG